METDSNAKPPPTDFLHPWYDVGRSLARALGHTMIYWADNLNSYPPDSTPEDWAFTLKHHGKILLRFADDAGDTVAEEMIVNEDAQRTMHWVASNLPTLWD